MRLNLYTGLLISAMLGMLAACAAPVPSSPPSPTPLPAQAMIKDKPISAVEVSLGLKDSASNSPEVSAGSTAHFVLQLAPSLVTVQRRQDGSLDFVSWEIWKDSPAIQMRTCFSATGPCSLSDAWVPFQSQVSFDVAVDWLGAKTFYASTEFRTSTGEVIQAGELGQDKVSPSYFVSMTVTGVFPAAPGGSPMPPAVLTAQAATQAASPLTGSIVIEDGRCCAGGVEGAQVPLHVRFQASSPAGPVTQMRIAGGNCQRDAAALAAPWEPVVSSKTYTVTLTLNWTNFQLNVQYRDEVGNLSPVYCAAISLEGMPEP